MQDEDTAPVRLTAAGTPRKPGKRGGARPGAGRPRKEEPDAVQYVEDDLTMLELLRQVALGRLKISAQQLTAARTAVQYESHKAGDGGKREARMTAAEEEAGSFPVTPAPLRAVGS